MDMNETITPDSDSRTSYCPSCRQAMRIAQEHLQVMVECPHCHQKLNPDQLLQASSPPPTPAQSLPPAGYAYQPSGLLSTRNKWIAGLLGVTLGMIGVHRFYLGFKGIGILQIVLSVCTGGIAGVWGFVEGILCFFGVMRDIDGLPLRD